MLAFITVVQINKKMTFRKKIMRKNLKMTFYPFFLKKALRIIFSSVSLVEMKKHLRNFIVFYY